MNIVDKLIQLDKESPKRILVIGDVMQDVYIQGRVEKCQEDCPKFIEEEHVTVPGGAANAARSLDNWNVEVLLLPGDLPNTSPVKTRFMVGDKCVFRHDDDTYGIDLELARGYTLKSLDRWKPDGVLISDYDKGFLTAEFIQEIVSICTLRNIPCVSDVKREPWVYERTIIKGNSEYFMKYADQARTLYSQAVTTYGETNPVVWDCGNVCLPKPYNLPKVECTNHVGAGDCFAAHLLLALTYGFSLKDSAAIAYSAGRVYVQHRYNEPPYPEAISIDISPS